MANYGRSGQSTEDNTIWPTCIAYWIAKATDTHSQYVILIAFPQRKWLHEGSSMLIYTYLTYLVKYLLDNLDGWLTVRHSITLVDLQLDAQNSYLFTYNTFIKILYMFRALPCSSSGGLRCNCIYAASGIVTLCR